MGISSISCLFVIFLVVIDIEASNLDSAGQKTCLSEHNRYRTELAKGNVQSGNGKLPSASAMNELQYSKDLEAKAQSWASSCPGMKHTPNPTYGQNLYWTSQTVDHSTALKQATKAWWDEARMYKGGTTLTMQIFNQGVGHFTQMAQSKATQVGCAVQACQGTYVVCNYNRQNMINQPIYETGKTCSKCNSCHNSLCKAGSQKSNRHRRHVPKNH